MRRTQLSVLSMLLALIMIVGVFASCADNNPNTNGTDAAVTSEAKDTEEANETSESEKGSEETEKDTATVGSDTVLTEAPTQEPTNEPTQESTEEPTQEQTEEGTTEEVLDTSPLELVTENYYPDFVEYETVSSINEEPVNIKVEAENYIEATIPWAQLSGSEFSNGILMRALVTGEDKLPLGKDGKYYAIYTVTVPKTGEYDLTAVAGVGNAEWTTDFILEINGEKSLFSSNAEKLARFESPTLNDNGVLGVLNFGKVTLQEGENTIKYTVESGDLDTKQWGVRLSTFFDHIAITRGATNTFSFDMSYAVGFKDVDDSEILIASAKVSVYDRRFPVKLNFMQYFKEAGEMDYTITDYFGNTVYSGKMSGAKNDYVTIERTIKNHPTGYFTFKIGEFSHSYIVTPPLSERTRKETPFAMDFASYYKIKDLNDMFAVASAARLAGVTWVRERAHWEYYEKVQGVYDFSSTDKHFRTLKKSGLNVLSIFYVSPAWALEGLGETVSRAGAFADTQLEVYQMMKELTKHYSGVIDAWEIWNESDGGFALESAELYSAWFKAASLGAIAGDPNVIVSHGGYCIPNEHKVDTDADGNALKSNYVHLSLMNDLMLYSSVFNYHSHTPQSGDLYNVDFRKTGMAKWIYPTMALYGALDKPVWLTEAGMRLESHNPSEEEKLAQTQYIVTSAVQSLAMGTDKHYWFLLSPLIEGVGDFGTFSADLKPYPTLAAEAVMTKVLGKGEYLGELPGLAGIKTIGPYGHVFNTGTRIASVLWIRKGTYEYTFDADLPVIVTDVMGGETLVQPVDGKITVTIGEEPIYITYSTPPVYHEQDQHEVEIENLEFSVGDKIVLSPEFPDYDINDAVTKNNGHLVSDGYEIKVRVSNFNDFAVTGTVGATVDGFTVEGCDTEVTVEPYSEAFVTLKLKQNSTEPVNGYITFVGTFGEHVTSKSVAHIRTEGSLKDDCTFTLENIIDSREYPAEKILDKVKMTVEGPKGEIKVLLDETEFDNFTYDEETGKISIDLSDIEEGNYILTVAMMYEAGYYDFTYRYLFYNDGTAVFREP